MSLIKDYFELTKDYREKYGDRTILFMQVGAFFEVYGLKKDEIIDNSYSELYIFSKICELSVSSKHFKYDNKEVMMAGFRDYSIDKYLEKMKNNGFTIAVHAQDKNEKNTTRSCVGIFSPGTSFMDNNDNMEETKNTTNNLMCIWLKKSNSISKFISSINSNIIVGITITDIYTGKIYVNELELDSYHNPSSFDPLEQLVHVYNPVECIIVHNYKDYSKIDDIKQYIRINSKKIYIIPLTPEDDEIDIATHKKGMFIKEACNSEIETYQEEVVNKYFNVESYEVMNDILGDKTIALQSLVFLLEFIHQHNPKLLKNLHIPELITRNDKCFLENRSLEQLNILSTGDNLSRKYSLYSIFNLCKTPMGKRLFNNLLLNPITNEDELNNSYEKIEECYKINYDKIVEKELMNINDLDKIKRKLSLIMCNPNDFYILYMNMNSIVTMLNNLKDYEYINNIVDMNKNIKKAENIINFINYHLIIDNCRTKYNVLGDCEFITERWEQGIIQKDVFHEYDKILETKIESRIELQEFVNTLSKMIENNDTRKKKSTQYIKIHTTNVTGMFLLLTSKRSEVLKKELSKLDTIDIQYKSPISGNNKTLTIDVNEIEFKKYATKSEVCISHPKIDKLIKQILKTNDNFNEILKDSYTTIQYKFIEDHENELHTISKVVSELDILFCKINSVRIFNLTKPSIKNNQENISYFKMKKARHILIENMNQNELYISNDVELGTEDTQGILLFGTNAVGKTSLIKSIGINIILAQCGFYVPCESLEYYPYEYIFTRIIGNDNIYKGLSTFAVEMSELRTILKKSNKNSLILGDELCSGTENDSAISIFMTSLDKLYNDNSSFIFATHFHEITNLEELKQLTNIKLKHMKVSYDAKEDRLKYDRLLCDGSGEPVYGLEVCKSLNMEQDFITKCYNIRNKYSKHIRMKSILSCDRSTYNKNVIKYVCEICKEDFATEVHHLQYQQDASDETNYITNNNMVFNKNHKANLISICDKCHDDIHKYHKRFKKTKNNNNIELEEI